MPAPTQPPTNHLPPTPISTPHLPTPQGTASRNFVASPLDVGRAAALGGDAALDAGGFIASLPRATAYCIDHHRHQPPHPCSRVALVGRVYPPRQGSGRAASLAPPARREPQGQHATLASSSQRCLTAYGDRPTSRRSTARGEASARICFRRASISETTRRQWQAMSVPSQPHSSSRL